MKIRSVLLGSCALAGLATGSYATDFGMIGSCDSTDIGHDFDSALGIGGHSVDCMIPDGHFGVGLGGHLSAANDEGFGGMIEGDHECFAASDGPCIPGGSGGMLPGEKQFAGIETVVAPS